MHRYLTLFVVTTALFTSNAWADVAPGGGCGCDTTTAPTALALWGLGALLVYRNRR